MEMNLRHAAALALVGWYLMYPPLRCVDKTRRDMGLCDMALDPDVPFSEWNRYGKRYATLEQCNEEMERIRHIPTDGGHMRENDAMRCTSSDELRRSKKRAN
jgi:hypothetical protein